jgi:phosphoribosylaminoimidazole synthetase
VSKQSNAYTDAGVNIDAGNEAVRLMSEAVRSTYNARVLAGIGSFGGVYDASSLAGMAAPALVASTDGVGTKTMLAAAWGRYASLGEDIVNHCINDILVQGAEPLFFLDYIASPRLSPRMIADIVGGCAKACREAGCVLLGGETAEMPGVYAPGQFDIAGTIVGVVERAHMLPLPTIAAGDVALGLPSSGPHTNGFSLIRKIVGDLPLATQIEEVGVLGDALLAPHRSYLRVVQRLRRRATIKGLAHITGGGLIENTPRILPADCGLHVQRGAWPVPPLFRWLQERGGIADIEMHRVFNMGVGMVVIAAPTDAEALLAGSDEMWRIGEVVTGQHEVTL